MAGRLRVNLAGRVGLEIDGVTVSMTGLGRPARSALAYLTCHRHRPVSRDELAEVLWGEELPQSWDQMLRGIIFKLRRVLSAAGFDANSILTSGAGAYALQLPPDAVVDVDEAAQALEGAEAAMDARYSATADLKAQAALEVASRGFALDGAGLWIEDRQSDLRELGLRALDVIARAALLEERWHAAVAAAEKVLSIEPFRESAYVRLMEAHAGAGSRGEALAAYERCRQILAEELGVGPSAQTEVAYLRLLGDDELTDRPPTAAPLPLPPALAPVPGRLFVGREAESQRLAAGLRRAEVDGRQAVLVAGEPGAGKTTLVANTARAAHALGARVLYGRCDEELGVPYQPFAEALTHYVSTCPLGELHAHTATWSGELARLVPVLARRVPEVRPPPAHLEDDRWRLFEAVVDLLRRASSAGPLVLILDDLHWAAAPTLLLLRHLLAAAPDMVVLVVATYRHTEVSPGDALERMLVDLRRLPGVERLTLEGLDEEEVRAFVEATGSFSIEEVPVLARTLHARTAGNPFFVEELLRHWSETRPGGVEQRFSLGSVTELEVPDAVVDIVRARVDRLSPAANRALLVGSVVGAEFDLDVLEEASRSEDVLDAMEEAARAHLVQEVGRAGQYRFAHAVVRHALYGTLSQARRARMHRDVGYALEALTDGEPSQLPALAQHFAAAASCGCGAKAADYALAAASAAIRDTAWEHAVTFVERGIEALALSRGDETARLIDLLVMLGEAQRRAGMPQHRDTLLEAARLAQSVRETDRLAQAALANNRGYCSVSWAVDYERVGVLRAALAAVGQGDLAVRARLLANLAAETLYSDSLEQTRRLSDESLDIARALDDPVIVAAVLTPRFNIIRGDPGTLKERQANAQEFVAAAELLRDPAVLELAWGWRAMTAMESADLEEANRCLGRWEKLDEEVRQPTLRWYLTYSCAAIKLFQGKVQEADQLSRDALVLGMKAGHQDARLVFGAQQFQMRLEQGRLDRLDRIMAQTTWDSWAVPRDQALQLKRASLAMVYRTLGRRDDARQVFDELAKNRFEDFARLPSWTYAITGCASVCAYLGDVERAAILFDLLSPHADQVVTLASLAYSGSMCHYLGMLAATLQRHAQADELFMEAARVHERMEAPGWLARTHLEWARLLEAAGKPGDLPRARDLLREAVEAASCCGVALVEQEERELSRRLRHLAAVPPGR